ncbi:hypothetical protein [Absidia glauca]|uniref:Uncharacterized protein n=1 Tax=Absidia glauca TaxID=4829 RepID=A0A163JHX1_ABSGL|nr:hypothetical protein [Absidia glauca]
MENQSSELFFMQHLASISHQKIYPSIQSKIEMPLWKTLHVTRLWNHAREKEIYLTQQQQKNDWWFHQMITSTPVTSTTTTSSTNHYDAYHINHQQLLDSNNDLSQSWFGDDSTTTTVAAVTVAAAASEEDEDDDDDDDDEIDHHHDTNRHPSEPGNNEPADSLTPTTPVTTKDHHTALLSHTPIEALWTEDELVSLLAVTQDRKRKYEEEPTVVCQKGGPTPPPANRPDSSLPMVKV